VEEFPMRLLVQEFKKRGGKHTVQALFTQTGPAPPPTNVYATGGRKLPTPSTDAQG